MDTVMDTGGCGVDELCGVDGVVDPPIAPADGPALAAAGVLGALEPV